MQDANLQAILQPVLTDVHERASVAGRFIDKDQYQIYMATLWANMVLNPGDINLKQSDLEGAHDVLNTEIGRVLGPKQDLTECYRYLNSKSGEKAMQGARLNQTHKDMLLYFASMILDPDGHKRWLDEIKEP
jgi:hypothetical protein